MRIGNIKIRNKVKIGDIKIGVIKQESAKVEDLTAELTEQDNLITIQKATLQEMSEILKTKVDGGVQLQEKKVAPTENTQIITPDDRYGGLKQVEIEPIPLRKDEWGGYDWIIEPSFEKDQEFYFNGEYIKQVIVPMVYEQNFKALAERTITKVDNNRIYNVGAYAFQGCNNLTSVKLQNASSIGMYAFYNCTGLTNIDLPTLNTINSYGFSGCSALKEINIPHLQTLAGYAFYNCKAIETLILSNITSIGAYSLAGLTSCKLIQIDKCTFPATLTQYFASTTGRIVLTFTNMIYNGCFRVSKFTEIVLPQNNVVGMATTGAFNGSSVADGTGFVYVPDDLVESYKKATNWTSYADQIKPLSQLPVLEV